MGFLMLGDAELLEIQRVVAHATKPGNEYAGTYKGPENGYSCVLGSYKAVFTITKGEVGSAWGGMKPTLIRHLSVVVWPANGRFPNGAIVQEIARAFGFGGIASQWGTGFCDCGCLAANVTQPYVVAR